MDLSGLLDIIRELPCFGSKRQAYAIFRRNGVVITGYRDGTDKYFMVGDNKTKFRSMTEAEELVDKRGEE